MSMAVHVIHSHSILTPFPSLLDLSTNWNTRTHRHCTTGLVSVSAQQAASASRQRCSASQFCLFKDQAVLLGKWFWRRARSTRISKSLVSHQNRCNFIFSSSSIKPGSRSLWPASLHSNNSTKWDRAHELCCFSPTFCVALSDSPWIQITGRPMVLSLTHTVEAQNKNMKEGRKEGRKRKKGGGQEEHPTRLAAFEISNIDIHFTQLLHLL